MKTLEGRAPEIAEEARHALKWSQESIADLIRATRTVTFRLGRIPMLNPLEPAFAPRRDDPGEVLRGDLRSAGRLLRADAGRCWDEGETDECAERLAAIVRLSRTIDAAGGFSAMTKWVLLKMAVDSIRLYEAEEEPALSERDRRIILDELRQLKNDDPAGLRDGWLADAKWNLAWMRQSLVGDDAGQKWDEVILANEPDEDVGQLVRDGPAIGDTEKIREVWSSHLRRYPDRPARALSGEEIQELVSAAERHVQQLAKGWAEGKPAAEEVYTFVDDDRAQIIRVVLGEALSLRRMSNELRVEITECIEALEGADKGGPR